MKKVIQEADLDILREMGNIGAAHAATSLASLLQCRVDMSIPRVYLRSIEDAAKVIPGSDKPVACVFFSLEGDIQGYIAHVINAAGVANLAEQLIGPGVQIGTAPDAMTGSMISEIGNVLTGAFLNAIADMTAMSILPSTPLFAFDMVEAIMATLLSAICGDADQVLLFETVLKKESGDIDSHLLLLPDEDSLQKLYGTALKRF
ncbi:MAG: chemotaxis protein CheC [Bacillota bacterium]|uniref:chemotaxis protein CheC n=1 Tax=Desulforudis sp. DRI-14 TaxID=3459793 RepID=UPI00346A475D